MCYFCLRTGYKYLLECISYHFILYVVNLCIFSFVCVFIFSFFCPQVLTSSVQRVLASICLGNHLAPSLRRGVRFIVASLSLYCSCAIFAYVQDTNIYSNVYHIISFYMLLICVFFHLFAFSSFLFFVHRSLLLLCKGFWPAFAWVTIWRPVCAVVCAVVCPGVLANRYRCAITPVYGSNSASIPVSEHTRAHHGAHHGANWAPNGYPSKCWPKPFAQKK